MYFKKDLFPETLQDTDDSDWQELTPFDILIKGVKLKSTPPVSSKIERRAKRTSKTKQKRETSTKTKMTMLMYIRTGITSKYQLWSCYTNNIFLKITPGFCT